MQPTILFFLLLCGSLTAYTQNGYWYTGAAEAGFANATAAYSKDNLMFHNIGALGLVENSRVSFGYDYRGFVEGLNNVNLQFLQKSRKVNFGFSLFKTGDDILNEFVASAGVGQKLGIASLGIKINYYQSFSEAYGYHRAYTVSAGGIAELMSNFFWGTYIENVGQHNTTEGRISIPVVLSTGFTYYPIDKLMLSFSGTMDDYEDVKIKSGLAYKIIPEITLRTGVNWYYKSLHYGIGFNIKKISIDYALVPVVQLGNLHSLTLKLNYQGKG